MQQLGAKKPPSGRLSRVFMRTFLARAVAALGTLALLFVAGRLYGAPGVGVLALAQAILLGTGRLARGGMDNALMKYVGRENSVSNALLYLRWALAKGALLSVIFCVIIILASDELERLFEAPGLSLMLLGMALSLPAFVCSVLCAGFFKGIHKPATACFMENGAVALYASLILWCYSLVVGANSYALLGWAYLAASVLVAAQASFNVWRWRQLQLQVPARESGRDLVSRKQFDSTSRAFFITSLSAFMQNVVAMLIAGYLLATDELGLYKSAQQLGLLIAFVLVVINAIFPPRFAALYQGGDAAGLSRLARQGALLGLAASSPFLLLCMFFPSEVLQHLGEGFVAAAPLLQIIAVAQVINVATGSVAFLLNMTGHEVLMRNIALSCNALGLVAFWVMTSKWGATGAACALAFTLILQNMITLIFVWRRLGIWTLPIPNLLAIVGVDTQNRG